MHIATLTQVLVRVLIVPIISQHLHGQVCCLIIDVGLIPSPSPSPSPPPHHLPTPPHLSIGETLLQWNISTGWGQDGETESDTHISDAG